MKIFKKNFPRFLLVASVFLSVTAYAEKPTPEDWNGIYGGINLGVNASQNKVTQNGSASADNNDADRVDLARSTAASLSFNGNNNSTSGIGGLTLGYSKIINDNKNVLLGAEADIMFGGGSVQKSYSGTNLSTYPATATQTTTNSSQLNSLSTIRARIGFLPDPALLIYVTGGLAIGNISATNSISGTTGDVHGGAGNYTSTNSASGTNTGWVAGLGAEYRFAKQWSLKGDWLHYDLGSISSSSLGKNSSGNVPTHLNTLSMSTKTAFSGDIIRLGLNYRF